MIIQAKRDAEQARKTPDDPNNMDMTFGGNVGYADYLEKEYIPELEKAYQNAPEKRENTLADGTLTLMPMSEGGGDFGTMMAVQAFENVGADWAAKGTPGKSFRAFNNAETMGKSKVEYTCASIRYSDMNIGQVIGDTFALTPELVQKVGMSPRDAQKMAEDIIKKYNLPFAVSETLFVDNSEYIQFQKENPDDQNPPEKYGAGYEVRCVRMIGDAPVAYIGGESNALTQTTKDGVTDPRADSYSRSWSYERMSFKINSSGIFAFDWDSPLDIQEMILDKSELLPFEKIDSIFNKMITVIYEPQTNIYSNITLLDIKVDKIKLELMRITEQNSIENGLLIPVWRFYGSRKMQFENGEPFNMEDRANSGCVLVINAIDGSIIDQIKGY